MSKSASENSPIEPVENPIAEVYDQYIRHMRRAERLRYCQHALVWLAISCPLLLTAGVSVDKTLIVWAVIGLAALAVHVVRDKALTLEDYYFKKWRSLDE